MDSGTSCKNCDFYVITQTESFVKIEMGYCCRYPPQLIYDDQVPFTDKRVFSRFPEVLPSERCGEFRRSR